MEAQDIRTRLLALLTTIAPDIDPATLDPVQDVRDQVDFDSMDRLHFAMAISEEFHIDIPEQDYPRLGALQKACEYVQVKLSAGGSSPATGA
jgi:acyl carrier protein